MTKKTTTTTMPMTHVPPPLELGSVGCTELCCAVAEELA